MLTRAEQKEQRYRLILSEALRLFVTRGYNETKISDIASAANMSMGLMFHYFSSKEQLYVELVKESTEQTRAPREFEYSGPLDYFEKYLEMLFACSKSDPVMFDRFVLLSQARRNPDSPEEAKEIAMQTDTIEQSAKIIRLGQFSGLFRAGDAYALSVTFWRSVQGIMEGIAKDPQSPLPQAEWLIDIIKNQAKD